MAGMNDILTLHKTSREGKPFQDRMLGAGRTIWAEKKPLHAGEFHNAKMNGIDLQHIMLVRALDYENERIVEYQGESYSIYRAYHRNEDWVELYLSSRGHSQ